MMIIFFARINDISTVLAGVLEGSREVKALDVYLNILSAPEGFVAYSTGKRVQVIMCVDHVFVTKLT